MAETDVWIVRTGAANLASVCAAFMRIGANPLVTDRALHIATARRVVLPGVGAFGMAMEQLREHGLDQVLIRRINTGRPTLAVCLGVHLLCEASEESPGVKGLGVLPTTVTRFPDTVRVPQLGWNKTTATADAKLLDDGYAYFANSYRLTCAPDGWEASFSEHGGRFVAALERGSILACQFHPELSGEWGMNLIRRWLATADGRRGSVAC